MAGPVPIPCLRAVLAGDPSPPLPPDIARVEVIAIGALTLPTGRVVACDPGILVEQPFTRSAPVGTFPVRLYVAHFNDGDQRVAAAELLFDDLPPEHWEHAVTPGQEAGALHPGRTLGYGVDSGTGCFMDLEAARQLTAALSHRDEFYDRTYSVMETTYVHTRSWAVVGVDGSPGHDVAAFSSGMGDGAYGSYWGLNGDRVVRLVTDFGLLVRDNDLDDDVPHDVAAGETHHAPEPLNGTPTLDDALVVEKGATKRWWEFWK